MEIVLLSASYRGGGAERVQITLAREFVRLGHSVHFVAFEEDGPLCSQITEGIHQTCFSTNRALSAIFPLVRFLRTHKPDVVIAGMAHVGIIACIAQRIARWRGKLIIRLDGLQRHGRQSVPMHKRVIQDLLQRYLFHRIHAVIAVSTGIAEEFVEEFRIRNCHVIPNPVATSLCNSDHSMMPWHPFFDCGEPIIIAIGRLHKVKGFQFLLEAFAALRKTRRAKLLILGEGDERPDLEANIEKMGLGEHVSLPGYVDNPLNYMKYAAVYALSSVAESFGLALVEALSIGIPVISTQTEGPRDIINHPDLGELVCYGDVHGFSGALRRAIDQCQRNRDRRIARAMDFAPDRMAVRYLRLIKKAS